MTQYSLNRLRRILERGCVGFLLLMMTGCSSVTVFQSSFDSNAVGAPPAHNQSTGTIDVSGAPGSVVIVSPPPNATGNWAQIARARGPEAPISTMQCTFSQFQNGGSYSLVAVLYIPTGSGLATVEFDTSPQAGPPSTGFLHLDFLQNNKVRINDNNSQIFGTFPRDQFFTLAVNMEITSSSATAHANLFGNGASGTSDDLGTAINVSPLSLAQQIGEVRFYMGFPWNGSFDATNIIVTRK